MKIGITNGSSFKEQLQADWTQNNSSALDYIKNKPTVDQTYNASSTNAQSGTAVAGAIANFLTNQSSQQYSFAVGPQSGCDYANSTAIGYHAVTNGQNGLAIGYNAITTATSVNAIQIGTGTNSTSDSAQIESYKILDLSTGLIPDARISTAIARVADITSLQAQADWAQSNPELPDYIKNKPTTLSELGITDIQSKIDADHKLNGAYIQNASISTNQLADSSVTSDKIKDGTITNTDISADANIASSKIRFSAAQDAALASGINSTKVAQITKNATDIDNLETWQTGASIDIANLKTTVGGAASGLVKDVADLKNSSTSQGARLTTAEGKISSLETTVGNSSSGLVKDVADLKSGKQDKLTAGTGIDITNGVISNTNASATWGNITGTLANQTDLKAALDAIEAEAAGDIAPVSNRVSTIEGMIPNQASDQNQLADKNFVNSSIQTNTAFFDGSWNTWADVPSTVEGFTTEGFEAPSANNYLVVIEDETQDGGTWRYKYSSDSSTYNKNNWRAEYQVNETPLTAEQLAALNSGITTTLVGKITANETTIAGKQDTLTPGTGIDITNGVISTTVTDLSGLKTIVGNNKTTLSTHFNTGASSPVSTTLSLAPERSDVGAVGAVQIETYSTASDTGGYITNFSESGFKLNKVTAPSGTFDSTILDVSDSAFTYKGDEIALAKNIPAGAIVDQTYDGTSVNAQSGVAIEGAGFIKNESYFPNYELKINASNKITIGSSSENNGNRGILIGTNSEVGVQDGIAIGYQAQTLAQNGIQLGTGTNSTNNTFQVWGYTLLDKTNGLIPDARLSNNIARTSDIPVAVTVDQTYNSSSANAQSGKAIAGAGFLTNSATLRDASLAILGSTDYGHSVVIGPNATSSDRAVAIGKSADASGGYAIAIGFEAVTSSQHAIQIGQGTNNSASLQIESYPLLNLNNGLIPDARLSSNIARISDIPAGIIVDQTYSEVSANPPSGVAIANAGFIQNTAGYSDAISIGNSASRQGSVTLGKSITMANTGGDSGGQGVAIGYYAKTDDFSVAIGSNAKINSGGTNSIAIGSSAITTASNAVQIGTGTNETANSLQVKTYKLLDTSTGLIPDDRISSNIARASSVPTVDQTYNSTSTNAQSGKAIDGAKFLRNTASATNSLAILGSTSSTSGSIAIGKNSSIFATGTNGGFQSIAIGNGAQVGSGMSDATQAIAIGAATVAFGTNSIAIGHRAQATDHSIQLGYGKNTTAKTLQIGFGDVDSEEINYQLLDGNTGLIPDARLSSNIARVADLPSAQVQSDWNVTDTTSKAYIANKPTIPTVDQTYSASSTNAQSGKAIAGAGFLQNTATGSQSLAIGSSSTAPNSWSVAIGALSSATSVSTAVGWNAKAGDSTNNTSSCVAIGRNALASGEYSTCVGVETEASGEYSVALGIASKATARNAIQIGFGTNNTASTLSIGFGRNGYSANYELLNGTTGKIPNDRLNLDSTPTSASTNGITSGAVYTALQNVHIDVDSALSTTSENPVQNKVVKSALDAKQNTLTWTYDSTTETLTIA